MPSKNLAPKKDQQFYNTACRPKKRYNWLFLAFLTFMASFLVGFCYFLFLIYGYKLTEKPKNKIFPKADAIIVLTGGKNRIKAGFKLLEGGYGKRLLISGVHQNSDKLAIAQESDSSHALFQCCVDLGPKAINTLGNAIESAMWLKKHRYKKLYLVTSDYHMPRSLLEFRSLMPDREFIPFRVKFASFNAENRAINYYAKLSRLWLLEYLKYLREKLRYLLFTPQSFLQTELIAR